VAFDAAPFSPIVYLIYSGKIFQFVAFDAAPFSGPVTAWRLGSSAAPNPIEQNEIFFVTTNNVFNNIEQSTLQRLVR
jgi:hypothetical protein